MDKKWKPTAQDVIDIHMLKMRNVLYEQFGLTVEEYVKEIRQHIDEYCDRYLPKPQPSR